MAKKERPEFATIGQIITSLREQAKITSPHALARLADLNSTVVSRLENDERDSASFGTLCKLADALGFSLDDVARATGMRKGRPRNMTVSAEIAQLKATLKQLQRIIDKSVGSPKPLK